VTVNGTGDDPPHVRAFPNPSLTDDDLERGRHLAERNRHPRHGLNLAFVGRVEPEKGALQAVRTAVLLDGEGYDVHLDVVGDGPSRPECEAEARAVGLDADFYGWVDRRTVQSILAVAHVLLLPTRASEGWPKVLSEAMAFGTVPVAGDVSSIRELLGGAGLALPGTDPADYAAAVRSLLAEDGLDWAHLREQGLELAPRYSFAAYLAAVEGLFADRWDISLRG
jgi:glycosyltransferase involved in cell wall biosynthesis